MPTWNKSMLDATARRISLEAKERAKADRSYMSGWEIVVGGDAVQLRVRFILVDDSVLRSRSCTRTVKIW